VISGGSLVDRPVDGTGFNNCEDWADFCIASALFVGFGNLLAFFCKWNQICWFSFGFHLGLAGEEESKSRERRRV